MKRFWMIAFLGLTPCLAQASSDSYFNYLRGLTEERAGHATQALEAYEKVVQEDPKRSKPIAI